jgi:hypothetical protein
LLTRVVSWLLQLPAWLQDVDVRSEVEHLLAVAKARVRFQPFNCDPLAAASSRCMLIRIRLQSEPARVVHTGINCDGCGMRPIIGIRYKWSDSPLSLVESLRGS